MVLGQVYFGLLLQSNVSAGGLSDFKRPNVLACRAGMLLEMSVEIVMLLRVNALYGNNRRSGHSRESAAEFKHISCNTFSFHLFGDGLHQ